MGMNGGEFYLIATDATTGAENYERLTLPGKMIAIGKAASKKYIREHNFNSPICENTFDTPDYFFDVLSEHNCNCNVKDWKNTSLCGPKIYETIKEIIGREK